MISRLAKISHDLFKSCTKGYVAKVLVHADKSSCYVAVFYNSNQVCSYWSTNRKDFVKKDIIREIKMHKGDSDAFTY